MDRGRPFGTSTDREARDERWDFSLLDEEWWRDEDDEDEWCLELLLEDLEEEWWDEDEDEDLDLGTSKMFSSRPVVGSLVEASLGLCETW